MDDEMKSEVKRCNASIFTVKEDLKKLEDVNMQIISFTRWFRIIS